MILSNRSMYTIPHQGIGSPHFSLFLISLLVELRVGDEEKAYLHCIFCKVKNRIQRRKQVIQSDQDVHVYVIFSGWNSHPFLHDSIFYFGIWAIFLLRFFFFFLYASGHDFFCIAHIFSHDEYGESCQRDGVFLCGWEA